MLHALVCDGCGARTRAARPRGVDGHALGPRATALVALLTGRYRLSRRAAHALLGELTDVPLALGSVPACERQVAAALAGPVAAVQAAVAAAPVVHLDETGWRQAGGRRWLFVATTPTLAAFAIHARRDRAALHATLGAFDGVLVSDRAKAFAGWPARQHQLCWAHLRRDFVWLAEQPGAAGVLGVALRRAQRALFAAWRRARDAPPVARRRFARQAAAYRRQMTACLRTGTRLRRDATARRFCVDLLAVFDRAWTFARVDGVEPTNNAAERALRSAVLWRKQSFGTRSAAGCIYVTRMLCATHTLRLQDRPALPYLTELVAAERSGRPLPSLLPIPTRVAAAA